MDDKIKEIDTLMVRFLQQTSTDEEKKQFLSWLNNDSENELSFFQMKEIYDSRKRIFESSSQEIKPQPRIRHNFPSRRLQPLFSQTWVRYAAIIAVIFGAAISVHHLQQRIPAHSVVYVKQMVVHNSKGVYSMSLPDGSKVWLHGATTLTYPEQFSDSIRIVDLQGEAYFSVLADEFHPFVVQTPTAKVCAIGTEFNITAYPDDRVTTTTLVKGTVQVLQNHHTESVQLKPGQQIMTGFQGKKEEIPAAIQEINIELYTDWKDGIYRFKNESFQNITLRLERMYGVKIHIENEDLKKDSFSGMFTTDHSLKEIFEIIDISNPISYTVKDKVVSIRNKKNR